MHTSTGKFQHKVFFFFVPVLDHPLFDRRSVMGTAASVKIVARAIVLQEPLGGTEKRQRTVEFFLQKGGQVTMFPATQLLLSSAFISV